MFLDFLRACLGLYINYWYCLVGVLIYSGYGVLVDGFGSCTQSPNSVRVGFQKEIWYVSEQLFRIFFFDNFYVYMFRNIYFLCFVYYLLPFLIKILFFGSDLNTSDERLWCQYLELEQISFFVQIWTVQFV